MGDGFDYALLPDEDAGQAREDLAKTKGFFILPSELFCNGRKKAASDENLNMTLEDIFHQIEESAKGREQKGYEERVEELLSCCPRLTFKTTQVHTMTYMISTD